ncbi:MAG: peptidoglycan DD-metalloendopeptidase family protein [Clostridiales bacterium]|nr:peptidoglycan DD-metalloendopeptidase family protein [Clostridiales bacterium]
MKQKKANSYRVLSVGLIAALSLPAFMYGSSRQSMQSVYAASRSVRGNDYLATVNLSTYEDKLKEAENKKKELEANKQNTLANIKKLEAEKNNILNYIKKLDMQLNDLTASLEKLEAEIASTKEELDQTRNDLEAAKEKEASQYETMKKRIQYLYENGSDDIVQVFLSSGNIIDFLNQVEYSKKISEYDGNMLNEYIATKELIQQQETYLAAKLDELKTAEEEQLFEQQTLQELSAQKGAEIERYTAAIGADEELFQEYADQITAVNANIQEIKDAEAKRIAEEKRKAEEERKRAEEEAKKQALANQNNGNSSSGSGSSTQSTSLGKMTWPLPGDGRIFSKFGYRVAPTAGASTYHRGVDIGGAQGASIVAALPGTVTEASYSVSGGNYVNIDHGNGFVTRYLHCSKLLVSPGDKVTKGQTIALVGSTGISTGPHLHFSVVLNGTYVDPLIYISY